MKRVAILQSNYIPWRGYFSLIKDVDEFIFYDDVQYTVRDWRNRNKIKTNNGEMWLTIPCGSNCERVINEVEPVNSYWQKKHWESIRRNYSKSRYWTQYKDFFEDFYINNAWTNLSELNQYLIKEIAVNFLDIKSVIFQDSRAYCVEGKKEDRLLNLLKTVDARTYVSGPAAKAYLNEERFKREDIDVIWFDYNSMHEYRQLHGEFVDKLSILDLLFNHGDSSKEYL